MIHKFEFDGTKIVLDVNSSSVHVVDDLTWLILDDYTELSYEELLKKYCAFPETEVKEVVTEIKTLVNEGLLYAEDKTSGNYSLQENPIVKSICLHVAHDCNLRCEYCFAATGDFGGERGLMSSEVGKAAIDLLIKKSAHRKNIEIDFFGGEPLLNFAVVKELVAYGKEKAQAAGKNFKFTLTTNAVLLDQDIQDYLNQNEISVVLSLDGRPEVNDKMRYYADGSGSYEDILPNLKSFIFSRDNQNYYLRGTYTRQNLDFSKDVLHMADLGFKELSVEPVVAPENADYAFREEDLSVLEEQYEQLTRAYLQRAANGTPFNFFHFNLDLNGGPCLPKRLSGCGAGHEYMAVSPEGDLYPCHQFVGKEEYKLGNVLEDGLKDSIIKTFQGAHVLNKDKCKSCWAKFFCSGGCHANAVGINNDLYQPYEIGCRLEKKRVECAIYIQAKKAELA